MEEEEEENFPASYCDIKKLVPVVLDFENINYSCWANFIHKAVGSYNLLHHINPPCWILPNVPEMYTPRWFTLDAIVRTWIHSTVSPDILAELLKSSTTTAMESWALVRHLCDEYYDPFNHKKKKKKKKRINIDLNEEYQEEDDPNGFDIISGLPDDVLVYMLSLAADMKTAARTSLLSKRWRYVWTHLMDLDFNDPETDATATRFLKFPSIAQPVMDDYAERVNQVITRNRAPYLNTLRIHFPLNKNYVAHIHNWLKFAFAKQVRNLDLNFMAYYLNLEINNMHKTDYPTIHLSNIFSINPALIANTTLKSLHLKSVNMEGHLLQWVLTHCHNLEHLSLYWCLGASADEASSKHQKQKLVVKSLKLKHLMFYDCLNNLNIEALHLTAPNLTSFIFYEHGIDVEYCSVPSLVDANFGGSYFHQIFHDLDTLSSFSSQLVKLSIFRTYKVNSASIRFPTFVNVQQLEVALSRSDKDLISSVPLMQACPLLQTFKLKLMYPSELKWPSHISLARNSAQMYALHFHQHLKVVEYVGYDGCASAAELALCLTTRAPVLKRFIFNTRQPQYIDMPRKVCPSFYRDQTEILRTTELLAKHIQGRRRLVDVVIL